MTPLDRRRRGRRRPTTATVLTVAVVAVALLILIGGATRVGQASVQYDRSVNRTYALQASVIARQSNQTAAQLRRLMGSAASPSLQRLQVQQSLDTMVQATAQQAAQARSLTPPEPSDGVAGDFASSMDLRAQALAGIRTTADRLLGGTATTAAVLAAPLPPGQAVAALTIAGSMLRRSDLRYAAARHALRLAPGHGSLPASVWSAPRAWAPGALTTLVQQMVTSTTLAPSVALELTAVRLEPPVLPPAPPAAAAPGTPGTPAGAEVVPPTRTLQVSLTVDNIGDVDQPAGRATVSLAPIGAGTPVAAGRSFAVAAGSSVTVAFSPLPVRPGATYSLSVNVVPPAAQVNRDGLSLQYAIHVAPGT